MIEYKNVVLRYTDTDILKDVNLHIEDGEFMVLVGPSGSGKTTMIKMINRLLEPTDGNIYMDGKRIKDYDERELRLSTGYVLQAIALFPNLTVAENIALIPEMKGWTKSQIASKTEELLDKVGLPAAEYANRKPSELSGGEQQRIGIVRAINWRTKDSIDGRALFSLGCHFSQTATGSYQRLAQGVRHDHYLCYTRYR